jgi:hypothetical protein
VCVQGRDEQLGHVGEEVPLGVAQVGVAQRHRSEGRQGGKRVDLLAAERLARAGLDRHEGAHGRVFAGKGDYRGGGLAPPLRVPGSSQGGAPLLHDEVHQLGDGSGEALQELFRALSQRFEKVGRLRAVGAYEGVDRDGIRELQGAAHSRRRGLGLVLGVGERAGRLQKRSEAAVVAVHPVQGLVGRPTQHEEGAQGQRPDREHQTDQPHPGEAVGQRRQDEVLGDEGEGDERHHGAEEVGRVDDAIELLGEDRRRHFLGIHFSRPPRKYWSGQALSADRSYI